jgi:ribosomal protein L37E
LQRSGRCPRCGYVLRFDGRNYSCEFCGFPRTNDTLSHALVGMGKELKAKAQRLLNKMRQPPSRPVYVYYPVAPHPCASCGFNMPVGTARCPNCGIQQETHQTASTPSRDPTPQVGIERNVLDYIVSHNGTISISQAARDLALPQHVLQSTIDQLKASGFLNQE